jgi:DNA/RNA-binding domain of Phe-tRNA-synthetase-like protein
MLDITATERWHLQFPGGCVGILEMAGVDNTRRPTPLEPLKRQVEQDLRARYTGFSRAGLLGLEVMGAYERYYRKFDKTYHVLLQLESVVFKGKSLPDVSPLVDANFTAELQTLVLTAGHDAAGLRGAVTIDATDGTEQLTQLNGTTRTVRGGDMCMADAGGVVCTILYGQDARTPITEQTTQVLYVSYAPVGVGEDAVRQNLERIGEYVGLVSPAAEIRQLRVFVAGGPR